MRRRFVALLLSLGLGCVGTDAPLVGQDHPLPEGEFGRIVEFWPLWSAERQLDILFVVENSRGMGREQGALAKSMQRLVDELTAPHLGGDFRVAVTTTDVGNTWWCNATTPEAGAFVYSSCLDREASFTSQDGGDQDFARACSDHCALDNAGLGIGPESKPWLEANTLGQTNLPDGVSVAEALACLLPQGVDGCGFEAPLGSMRRSLARAFLDSEPEFGFFRDHSKRVVVFLTEEYDCTVESDHTSIFDPEGSRVFWSDPEAPAPTSALCWNAGVLCEGEPDSLQCVAQHYDEQGEESTWGYAVMTPVYDFIEAYQNVDSGAHQTFASAIAIAGVDESGVLSYRSDTDAETLINFGVAPGCEAEPYLPGVACALDADCPQLDARCNEQGQCEVPERAFPPVRVAEFVSEVASEEGNFFSICQDEYGGAMARIAENLRDYTFEYCFEEAPYHDAEPDTPGMQPECVVTKSFEGQDGWTSAMVECTRAADGSYELTGSGHYVVPPEGEGICYAMRTDRAGLTPGASDDLDDGCEGDIEMRFELDYRYLPESFSSAHAVCRLE